VIVPRQTCSTVRVDVARRQVALRQDETAESKVAPEIGVGPAPGVGNHDDEGEQRRRVTQQRERLRVPQRRHGNSLGGAAAITGKRGRSAAGAFARAYRSELSSR